MFGVASAVLLAGACTDFNGVEPPEAGATADSATGPDGVGGSAGGASSSSSSGGGKTDSGGDASTCTPKDLPGLAIWLDATVGLTFNASNEFVSWKDQSGQLNDATLIGPCVDNQGFTIPCLGPSKDPGSLNGHDTLQFCASTTGPRRYVSVADSASVQFGTGDFAIFVVARYSAQSPFWEKNMVPTGNPLSNFTGVRFFGGVNSVGMQDERKSGSEVTAVASASTGLGDNVFRRLGGTRRGSIMQIWVNGVVDGTTTLTTVADVSTAGVPVRIGGPGVNQFYTGLVGNLAETVTIKGTISDADIAKLDAYFKTKWGL